MRRRGLALALARPRAVGHSFFLFQSPTLVLGLAVFRNSLGQEVERLAHRLPGDAGSRRIGSTSLAFTIDDTDVRVSPHPPSYPWWCNKVRAASPALA